MGMEVGGLTGAGSGKKSIDRLADRNGYWARDRKTRAGTVELRIPRLRKGSYFRRSSTGPSTATGRMFGWTQCT